MNQSIRLSSEAAEGLTRIGLGSFGRYNDPARLAFLVEVLKFLDDVPAWFPKGKWATIQHIEEQVRTCADSLPPTLRLAWLTVLERHRLPDRARRTI